MERWRNMSERSRLYQHQSWGRALSADTCLFFCTGSSFFNTSINFSTVRLPPYCKGADKQATKSAEVRSFRFGRVRLCRVRTMGMRCRAETGASSSFFAPSKISSHSFGYFLCPSVSSSCRLLAVNHRCDPTLEKQNSFPSVYLRMLEIARKLPLQHCTAALQQQQR